MEVVKRWWRVWMLRWRFEFFKIGIITRIGLDVCASLAFSPTSSRMFYHNRSGVYWGPIADFEMYSLTIESFEKSDDLDRGGGLGLCVRDAISIR